MAHVKLAATFFMTIRVGDGSRTISFSWLFLS